MHNKKALFQWPFCIPCDCGVSFSFHINPATSILDLTLMNPSIREPKVEKSMKCCSATKKQSLMSDIPFEAFKRTSKSSSTRHSHLKSTFKQTQVHKATIVDGQQGKLSWLHTFQLSCVGQTSRTHDNTRPWPIFLSSLEPSLNTLPLHHPNEEVVEQGAAST